MYIVSNAPPAIDAETHRLNVYGGLAVAVIDSIPKEGAVWAGITTNPNDIHTTYDHDHNVERLPIKVDDKDKYFAHYAPWCKKVVYASFHSMLDYAGLTSEKFASTPEQTESDYQAHMTTIRDFGAKLAAEILDRDGDEKKPIMVHDYQLIELADALRDNGLQNHTMGMFLHIPFPKPEEFWQIPHAKEILTSYLAYDLISFQDSERSLKNFVETVKDQFPNTFYDKNNGKLNVDGRTRIVKDFAASINPDATLEDAVEAEDRADVQAILKEADGRKIVFSAQRFDIIKGLPEGLSAIEQLLDEKPQLAKEAYFVFCCQPTKYDGVTCYEEYQAESLAIIDRIQDKHPGAFKLVNGLPRESVLGLMRHTDVMDVPTIIEGQNLVAKEYIVANEGHDKPRALVMSTGCAAYFGLRDAGGIFIQNPRNVAEHKEALMQAFTQSAEDARTTMKAQQQAIRSWTSIDYGQGLTNALREAAQTPHLNGFDRSISSAGITVAPSQKPAPEQDQGKDNAQQTMLVYASGKSAARPFDHS